MTLLVDCFLTEMSCLVSTTAAQPQSRIAHLIAAAGGTGFPDHLFDHYAGLARALLIPAGQFFLPAFDALKNVICVPALGDVPIALDFE